RARVLQEVRRLLSRLDRRRRGEPRRALHQEGRDDRISRARHGSDLAHRSGRLPRFHRHRRQGQRLLQGTEFGIASRPRARRPVMITAIVQFALPSPISLEEAARRFQSSAPNYKNLPGLIRKYYLRSEDGSRTVGVYLWESRQAAEAVYTGEWRARVQQLYGSTPEIAWFDTPVIVDNSAGEITKAA